MLSRLRRALRRGPDTSGLSLIERHRRVEGERLAAALTGQDDAPFRAAIQPVVKGDVQLWDDAHAAIQWTAQALEEQPEVVDRWLARSSDDPAPLLVRAVLHRIQAWEARDTDRDQFYDSLERASIDAERAADLAPENPLPLSVLTTIRLGDLDDLDGVRSAFEACIDRDPLNLDAHRIMLFAMGETWYGSNDQMLGFARDAVAGAPAGSSLHELCPHAHFIRFKRESDHDHDEALANVMRAASISEITDAYGRLGGGERTSSELSLAAALNRFAWHFYMADADARATEAFGRIGPHVLREPWDLLGDDALDVFATARAACAEA
ncbi:MAG: hypothetical protein AAFX05_08065 [Planctomycetota bacterium]